MHQHIFNKRLQDYPGNQFPKATSGCAKRKGTREQISDVGQLTGKCTEFNVPTVI